jgi:hypothetical protein
MSNLSRQLITRFGKAADTTDFTTVPSLIDLIPEKVEFAWPEREKLDRDPQRDDGSFAAPIVGALEEGDLDVTLTTILRGCAGNAGGAVNPETATDAGLILDVLTGTDSVDPAGAATTATGGTGATPNVTLTSGTNFPNGIGLLIPMNDGTFIPREVVSGGGTNTVVVDRTYSGTVLNGATVPRSCLWTIDPSVHMHKHAHLRLEAEGLARVDFNGCMGKGELQIDGRKYITMRSMWKATSATPAAVANPTVAPLTVGAAIVSVNSQLFVGNQAYLFKDFSLDFGGEVMPRVTNNGAQGRTGFTVQRKRPTARFKMYAGDSVSFGELTRAGSTVDWDDVGGEALNAGDAANTYDLALQFGARATGCLYLRGPAFVFTKRKRIEVDGLEGFDCEGFFSRASTGSPLRIHLF